LFLSSEINRAVEFCTRPGMRVANVGATLNGIPLPFMGCGLPLVRHVRANYLSETITTYRRVVALWV
jgi:hypothetical protein